MIDAITTPAGEDGAVCLPTTTSFAMVTALLTPVFVLLGTVFVFLHALKSSPKVQPAHDAVGT